MIIHTNIIQNIFAAFLVAICCQLPAQTLPEPIKMLLVEDLNFQSACDLKYKLLKAQKESLLGAAGWSEAVIKKIAYPEGGGKNGWDYPKRITGKLKKMGLDARMMNEEYIENYMDDKKAGLYLIRIGYELIKTNRTDMPVLTLSLYDKKYQLVFAEKERKFYKKMRKMIK